MPSKYVYDAQRNYLQRPLNINFKALPEAAVKSGDVQYVLMTLARVGNQQRTFQQLQPIYDHVRGQPNIFKINAAIVHANNTAKTLGCGITHPDGHHCLTPNAHMVCTKSSRSEDRRSTIVVYIDDSLFPVFNDSGADAKYPGMEIVKKRVRAENTANKSVERR